MPNTDPSYTEQGRLQIGTFLDDVGMPATNADIIITTEGEPNNIVEEVVTNSSGQSPVINLPAPPLDYSLGAGDGRPYSLYDINVRLEGFESTIIRGVQILPDTTALQDIILRPEANYPGGAEEISIEDHTLWGEFPPKTPEEEVKELPPAAGFVVLPEPVVPEYVVVHDGVPSNTAAPNYWIPFADYIKNVASCEIYSTWPDATIRANVLAILSFTLNRIYTEWYRGRGYNFTITSSTAYDQAFSYGRNIFEEISVIVDEMFTTFITRPDIRQPLFAQYCDGRRSSCPNWMTQWGSKYLGDQGYNTIDILRYYYGQNIYLMQAQRVAGVPLSFPGTVLQVGSRGQEVRMIQEQLNAISNNFPAIRKIRVDGIYGSETRTAVETFQQVFNMPRSGMVDFSTWYRISNIYVAVTRMAELT